ncbi:MAG TPA: HEAT repeat domain-containing protein [Thermoanaerobaculia bacterium]|jgi:cyclophilin family peptidyl-prolyl cis-trans isomerase/HEAT repeat protein/thiol-disulfide isomerase/thioredoxin
MRKLTPILLLAFIACQTATPPPPPAVETAPQEPEVVSVHGFTVAEEARLLQLEDQRAWDPEFVSSWVTHTNPLHRQRIALALGRIGSQTFFDRNRNGEREWNEKQAGVDELTTLSRDTDRNVRQTAAFALGETGDQSVANTLFTLTTDPDATVAAEAVEAIAKIADPALLTRYSWMASENWPEGIRAQAIRYLFRFNSDEAMPHAMLALASSSSNIRQAGAYALSRRAYPQARPQLELLMTDPDTLTRAYAAAALGRIADRESAPVLMKALGDMHPWVRTNAVNALARVYDKTPSLARIDDLPRIRAILEDPDAGTRTSAIDLFGYYARINETARQQFLGIQQLGSRWDREIVAGAIVKHLGSAGLGYLVEPTGWGKVKIAEASANTPVGTSLRAQFAKDPEPLVRAAMISNIPDVAVYAELPLVRAGMADADVVVRAAAIKRYAAAAVGAVPLDEKIRTLQEAEQKERGQTMNDARLEAIEALAQTDYPGRYELLKSLLKDNDPVVRRVAADAIETQLKRARPQFTPLPTRYTQKDYEDIVRWSRTPHTATIHMTRGIVELALLTQDAPMTTWNFAQLAKQKYFDNTTFMRVVPNFVVQGGDPRNDQSGGPGYVIRDEINMQRYTRGAVGMALSGPDTGGSQFFITHSPQPHLDGIYTVFARVYDGMGGVVDQTERGDKVETIAIDERPHPGASDVASVQGVPLPTIIGPIDAATVMAIPGYGEGRAAYKPDLTIVEMMKGLVRAGDRVEVYMGTWCPDSLREVPKFLRVVDDLDQQFGVKLPVSFVAVDRSKTQPAKLLSAKHVDKVATFIYYRGDQELGRIVETPQSLLEDDLLVIVAKP